MVGRDEWFPVRRSCESVCPEPALFEPVGWWSNTSRRFQWESCRLSRCSHKERNSKENLPVRHARNNVSEVDQTIADVSTSGDRGFDKVQSGVVRVSAGRSEVVSFENTYNHERDDRSVFESRQSRTTRAEYNRSIVDSDRPAHCEDQAERNCRPQPIVFCELRLHSHPSIHWSASTKQPFEWITQSAMITYDRVDVV